MTERAFYRRRDALTCYFSDERANGAGYNQKIGEVVSSDGGKTWGAEITAVGVNDGVSRPGMPAVLRMANGQYIIVFETPGVPGSNNSEIREKISSDGDTWSSDLGTKIQTADGHYLGATPDLAQTPPAAGLPNGELILDANTLPGGVALNTWYHLVVQATGCAFNVSAQPVGAVASTTFSYTDANCAQTAGQIGVRTVNAVASWRNISVTPGGTTNYTPVYAPWASGSTAGWATYGGSWAANGAGETYTDSAGGLGDKSLTGASSWGNGTLTADVQVASGNSNAGLVARVSNPGVGVDIYTGYYAGIDAATGNVLFGRSVNGWNQLATAPIPLGVTPNTWCHLSLHHVGCTSRWRRRRRRSPMRRCSVTPTTVARLPTARRACGPSTRRRRGGTSP